MRRSHAESGFSLVETLAALMVFSIVTLGIVPVLLTSVRGSNISRSYTQGKNVGLEAMERVRSLPFYIDYATQPQRVDVLDLYFPNTTVYNTGTCTGYFTTTQTCASTGHTTANRAPGYLTTCPGAGATVCPAGLPAGYSITYQTSFIQDEAPPESTVDPETYDRVAPPTGYRYDVVGSDLPGQLIVEMTITVRWRLAGRARTYELKTLLGDRQFGDLKVKANARVEYVINLIEGYGDQGNTIPADAYAVAGYSESKVESRRFSTADHTSRAMVLRLVDSVTGADIVTPTTGVTLGAEGVAIAPPDTTVNPPVVDDLDLDHTSGTYGQLMSADDTDVSEVEVGISGGTPYARGEFGSAAGSSGADLHAENRRAHTDFNLYNDITVEVVKKPSGIPHIFGTTDATTGLLGSGVEATATAEFGELRLFPTDHIRAVNNTHNGAVVVITDFTASVECDARTDGTTDTPDLAYSATLRYWFDPIEDDLSNTTDNAGTAFNEAVRYETITLNLSNTLDPLVAIRTSNPLVYDRTPDNRDVYLFPRTSPARDGYLSNWTSLFDGGTSSTADAGRLATANLDGVIDIETSAIERDIANQLDPDSGIALSIGALSCSAEDRR